MHIFQNLKETKGQILPTFGGERGHRKAIARFLQVRGPPEGAVFCRLDAEGEGCENGVSCKSCVVVFFLDCY